MAASSNVRASQPFLAKLRLRLVRWTVLRRSVQYLALLLFLVLFVTSRAGYWPGNLVNIPLRLDPLTVLAHLLSSRTFLAGSALALLTVLLTLVAGRAWCGWLCPLGTLLDLFPLQKKGRKPSKERLAPPESWRSIKYVLLLGILFAALLGNLTLLFLDPLTLLIRTLSTAVWPALDQLFTSLEATLYPVTWLQETIMRLDGWLRPVMLPSQPIYYRFALLYGALLLGVILLNRWAPRFWCRYLCPLGGLLGLISKIALIQRRIGPECKTCVLCTRSCPTGTIDPEKNFASDPGECTLCLDCMEACPREALSFTPKLSKPAAWNTYDPGRREALYTLGAAIAGIALFKSDFIAKRDTPHLVRPPGARENNLLAKCVRCGECVRVCPTAGLQPALSEAGLEGLWTPVLLPRLGYCDYACNACGQACPVEAIPPLSLEDKRKQIIGRAYIDENLCIAWADHTPCSVCEEMCPLPDKAITLEETPRSNGKGELITIQLPYVDRDKCIGCGLCEYKCPVNGLAAIRIYAPGSSQML